MKTKKVKYFLKQFQESLNDYWTSIRRLKKIPKQIDQVIELLKQGVKVNKSISMTDFGSSKLSTK